MSLDPHEEPAAIQTHIGAIFISLELSRSKWLITSLVPGGGQRMSKLWVEAGGLDGLLARFWASPRQGFAWDGKILSDRRHSGSRVRRVLDPPVSGEGRDREPRGAGGLDRDIP